MRGRLVAVALAFAVSGCSQPLDATAVLGAFDGSDTPILVVTQVCYSICSPYEAYPRVAVYADRSMVVVTPTGADLRLEATSYRLDDDAASAIAGFMVDGGLTLGGVRATATNDGIADGGGFVFETQVAGRDGYLHAPFLDSEPVTPDRTALLELLELLEEIAGNEDGVPLVLRWVAIGERIPPRPVPGEPAEVQIRPEGLHACFDLDPEKLPDDMLEMLTPQSPRFRVLRFGDGGQAVAARPLLPHETGCEDAQAMLVRFSENDAGLDLGGTG